MMSKLIRHPCFECHRILTLEVLEDLAGSCLQIWKINIIHSAKIHLTLFMAKEFKKKVVSNFGINTVAADGPAPLGAGSSVATVMTFFLIIFFKWWQSLEFVYIQDFSEVNGRLHSNSTKSRYISMLHIMAEQVHWPQNQSPTLLVQTVWLTNFTQNLCTDWYTQRKPTSLES